MTEDNSSAPRLAMESVSKRFGPTKALDSVSIKVRAGEVHALIGENGAGKSTLMKILSGALVPDSGRMKIDGEEYAPSSPLDGRKAGVAMIYQELSLALDMNIMENIVLGSEPSFGPFIKRGKIIETAKKVLARVGLSNLNPATIVGHLSNAQMQLVEIARNLAFGAKILILDEPTSSLSGENTANLFKLIQELKSSGYAIIYISHFLEEIREISDTFTVIRDGEAVGGGITSQTETTDIVKMMVGRDVNELYPRSKRVPGKTVLEISSLAGPSMPTDCSLNLKQGEILGISGVIGAGRTEFIRALFGLAPVKSGKIKVADITSFMTPDKMWKKGIGIVSEDRKNEGLAVELSIADNMTLPDMPIWVTTSWQEKKCARWIDKFQIKCVTSTQSIENLSGGNQQKVAIARLLHSDVDILLLDEPTRGIDIGSKAQIYKILDELASGNDKENIKPKAVIMISSYLPELLGCCDRIAVMCRGKLGEARSVSEWTEHSIMMEATGVTDNEIEQQEKSK